MKDKSGEAKEYKTIVDDRAVAAVGDRQKLIWVNGLRHRTNMVRLDVLDLDVEQENREKVLVDYKSTAFSKMMVGQFKSFPSSGSSASS